MDVYMGDYHVSLGTDADGNLIVDFDRLANEPDKAEPLRIVVNDTPVFDGTE